MARAYLAFPMLALLGLPVWLGAEPTETLIPSEGIAGAQGGLDLRQSQVGSVPLTLWGGRAGLMLTRNWYVGGAGYGGQSTVSLVNGPSNLYSLAYGGLFAEWTPKNENLFFPGLGLLMGLGGVSLDVPSTIQNTVLGPESGFFVAEPEATLQMNLTQHIRLGLGISYRMVAGSQISALPDWALSGFSASLQVRFGAAFDAVDQRQEKISKRLKEVVREELEGRPADLFPSQARDGAATSPSPKDGFSPLTNSVK